MTGRWRNREKAGALDISSVVAAFSEEQVVRIVGLSKERLRYWARTGFFAPSHVDEGGRLPYSRFYSFKDVVGLRTLEQLRVRNDVPLQHLRKVAEKLSHLNGELWISTTLYVVDRKVVVVNPETGQPQEAVSGQGVLAISLQKVIKDTSAEIVAFQRRPENTVGQVSRSRAIARNAPVVAGTRIPIGSIQRLHEDGYSVGEIIAEYPDLVEEDVEAALRHKDRAAA